VINQPPQVGFPTLHITSKEPGIEAVPKVKSVDPAAEQALNQKQQDSNQNRQERKLDAEQREKIRNEVNNIFDTFNTGLSIRYHEKSEEWYAVVENKVTKEVIKEVPPKYILDLHAKLKRMIGVFLDKKV